MPRCRGGGGGGGRRGLVVAKGTGGELGAAGRMRLMVVWVMQHKGRLLHWGCPCGFGGHQHGAVRRDVHVHVRRSERADRVETRRLDGHVAVSYGRRRVVWRKPRMQARDLSVHHLRQCKLVSFLSPSPLGSSVLEPYLRNKQNGKMHYEASKQRACEPRYVHKLK